VKYAKLVMEFLFCVLFTSLFSGTASAQCYFVFSSNYAVYASDNADANNIYTSVLIDGSASMTIGGGNCGPGYQIMQNQINSATHSPSAYNRLGTIGGWGTGSSGCVNCWLSYQNNQSIAANDGQSYVFDWQGEIDCSVAYAIFTSIIKAKQLERAMTKEQSLETESNCWWLYGPINILNCNIDSVTHCTPATTPPDMHFSPTQWQVYPISAPLFWWTWAPCEKPIDPVDGHPLGPWTCQHGWSLPALDGSLGNCTHNPN
jgi:hypothetical protein